MHQAGELVVNCLARSCRNAVGSIDVDVFPRWAAKTLDPQQILLIVAYPCL